MSQEVSKENKMKILEIVDDLQLLLHKSNWYVEDFARVAGALAWLRMMERDLRKDLGESPSAEETQADA